MIRFDSISGGNSIDPSDPVDVSASATARRAFSTEGNLLWAADRTPRPETFSGVYVGLSTDPTLFPAPDTGGTLDGGALFDATFTITSATGAYAGTMGDVGDVRGQYGSIEFAIPGRRILLIS